MLKNFSKKSVSLALAVTILTNSTSFVFATESYSVEKQVLNEQYQIYEESREQFELVDTIDTEFGTEYHIKKERNGKNARNLWDVVDILMAGTSWATFFGDASWGNFGWAVLDTAALLPLLPSSAYFRQGGKLILKSDEVAKFAKTAKGASAVNKAIKTYKYSDAITSTATKAVLKYYKSTNESQKLLDAFIAAANKGLVAANGVEGIKKLTGTIKNAGTIYSHEIKLLGKYSEVRIYGYQAKTGEWVFDWFSKSLH